MIERPKSLDRELDVQRAGTIPSLSPEQRFVTFQREYMRAKTRAFSNEAVANREAAAKPDNGRPRTELEAQLGKPRTGIEIRRILSKECSSLIFEDSLAFPERLLIRSWNHQQNMFITICAMEKGWMPEFSLMHVNEQGEVYKETRGWRTVVAKLIKAGRISKTKAEGIFGMPSHDSETWHKAVS